MNILRFRAHVIAVGLLVVLLGIAGIVRAQDGEGDASERFENLLLLENGDIIEDSFGEDSNAHLYAFYASEGDMVSINMTQLTEDTSLDPYLVLMSASGAVLAVDDDGGERFFSAALDRIELPQDGLYLVLATEAPGLRYDLMDAHDEAVLEDDLGYELDITGINQPDDVESFTLDAAEAEPGDRVSLTLDEDEPVDFVMLQGSEGDAVSLETTTAGEDDVDTLLYLFDDVGTRVAVNDDGEGIGLYSRIDGYTFDNDGQHLVLVTAYGFQHTEPDSNTPEEWSGGGSVELVIE